MEYLVTRNLSRGVQVRCHEVLHTAPHQIEFEKSAGVHSRACCVLSPCLGLSASVVPH
jgi:hypothetical protein